MSEKEASELFEDLFGKHPVARKFVLDYTRYVHMIDDWIDEDKNANHVLKTSAYALVVYTNPFFVQNAAVLGPIMLLVNNEYADSVEWENSGEDWKVKHADVLRHCGYNIFLASVLLIHGYDRMREISIHFRERSHTMHLHDLIEKF